MNVAILIRDLAQFGGGEKNVITLAEGLNEAGIKPDIFSESDPTPEAISDIFGKDIEYTFKLFPRPKSNFSRFITELLLPHPLKGKLNKYDFIYDFTNKPPVIRNSKNYLKYLYIMTDERVLQQSFLRKSQATLYENLAALGFEKFNKFSPHIINVTQSIFAQQEIQGKTSVKLPIIYPPVEIKKFKPAAKMLNQVISVGRIGPEKNHHKIINIAQKLPQIQFNIIGRIENKSYYKRLQDTIKQNKIANVDFVINAPFQKTKKMLEESLVYVSATENEHFGIAVVESIAAGCIPVVHDSGGHKETVPSHLLRFQDETDAAQKINTIFSGKHQDTLPELQKHIQKFDEQNFKDKLLAYLQK